MNIIVVSKWDKTPLKTPIDQLIKTHTMYIK